MHHDAATAAVGDLEQTRFRVATHDVDAQVGADRVDQGQDLLDEDARRCRIRGVREASDEEQAGWIGGVRVRRRDVLDVVTQRNGSQSLVRAEQIREAGAAEVRGRQGSGRSRTTTFR